MRIPTLEEKAELLGLKAKQDAFDAAKAKVEKVVDDVQDSVMTYIYDEHGLDPLSYFFNPVELYIRLSDHEERGLPNQCFIKINKGKVKHPVVLNSFSAVVANSIENLSDSLRLFSDMLTAVADPKVFKMIIDGHNKVMKKMEDSIPHQEVREANQELNILKGAAEVGNLYSSAFDTTEELDEFLGTLDKEQLQQFAYKMGIASLTKELVSPEEVIKVITHYFCVNPNEDVD